MSHKSSSEILMFNLLPFSRALGKLLFADTRHLGFARLVHTYYGVVGDKPRHKFEPGRIDHMQRRHVLKCTWSHV